MKTTLYRTYCMLISGLMITVFSHAMDLKKMDVTKTEPPVWFNILVSFHVAEEKARVCAPLIPRVLSKNPKVAEQISLIFTKPHSNPFFELNEFCDKVIAVSKTGEL